MGVRHATLRRGVLCALCAVVPLGLPAQGRAVEATDTQVKAAYLYNFARFIQWPSRPPGQAGTPFAICVVGADPIGPELDRAVPAAPVQGGPVHVRHLSDAKDVVQCQILFIGAAYERALPAFVAAIGTADVLTVSDMPRFTQRGGMVQFVTDGRRVRFEVDLRPARVAGLSFSSELLRVARQVRQP